jgi:hypothetical protein
MLICTSYMLQTKTVLQDEEHLGLASLCVRYLALPAFENSLIGAELERYVLDGTYAFFDYAVASWPTHVRDGLLSLGDTTSNAAIALEEDLDVFFEAHWSQPSETADVPQKVLNCARLITRKDIREKVMMSLAAVDLIETSYVAKPAPFQTTNLFETLWRIRALLETLVRDARRATALSRYYSNRFYKCRHVYCRWFYEGFATAQQQVSHHEKHDRAFCCPFQGCHLAHLGCDSEERLKAHIASYHMAGDTDDEFPDEPDEAEVPAPVFACDQCSKTFTRASNLKAHTRIHEKEQRPFKCPTCRSTFARQPDLNRHEKIHKAERNYVCSCGKSYKRRDGLTRHQSTPAALKVCVPSSDSTSTASQETGTGDLPAV